jgi:phosphoenolpyruvate carboxykinase (ATP)
VNTGWTGGPYGTGKRMPLRVTRRLLDAALDGQLAAGSFRRDQRFGFEVPLSVDGVPEVILTPRETWANGVAYDQQADRLARMFGANFTRFAPLVDLPVREAGPRSLIPA